MKSDVVVIIKKQSRPVRCTKSCSSPCRGLILRDERRFIDHQRYPLGEPDRTMVLSPWLPPGIARSLAEDAPIQSVAGHLLKQLKSTFEILLLARGHFETQSTLDIWRLVASLSVKLVLTLGVKLSLDCAASAALQSVELILTSITHTRCSRHARTLVQWQWNWGHSLIVHLNLRDDERQRSEFRTTRPASPSRTPFPTCDFAQLPLFRTIGERRNRTQGEMRTQPSSNGYMGHLRASKTAKDGRRTKARSLLLHQRHLSHKYGLPPLKRAPFPQSPMDALSSDDDEKCGDNEAS